MYTFIYSLLFKISHQQQLQKQQQNHKNISWMAFEDGIPPLANQVMSRAYYST
jgi:hypothetical protein